MWRNNTPLGNNRIHEEGKQALFGAIVRVYFRQHDSSPVTMPPEALSGPTPTLPASNSTLPFQL